MSFDSSYEPDSDSSYQPESGDSEYQPDTSDNSGNGGSRYLLFVWSPGGYRLEEREGQPPAPGSEVEVGDGRRERVTKIAPSPLPGDPRPCAYLMG